MWRPRKMHRVSAFRSAAHVHKAISQFIDGGLFHFKQPLEASERGPAMSWPRLALFPDLASDNLSWLSFAMYKLNLCLEEGFDFAHGVHDDILQGIYGAGEKQHLLLDLVRVNVPVGPWSEDVRWKQVSVSFLTFRGQGRVGG